MWVVVQCSIARPFQRWMHISSGGMSFGSVSEECRSLFAQRDSLRSSLAGPRLRFREAPSVYPRVTVPFYKCGTFSRCQNYITGIIIYISLPQ